VRGSYLHGKQKVIGYIQRFESGSQLKQRIRQQIQLFFMKKTRFSFFLFETKQKKKKNC